MQLATVNEYWTWLLRATLAMSFATAVHLAALAQPSDQLPPTVADGSGIEFFEARIRPLLVANCYECHNSADSAEGDLAVDWASGMADGGQRGSLLKDSDKGNLLLAVVRHEIPGLEMPEGGVKLSKEEVADLEKWLQLGAPDPRTEPPKSEETLRSTSWPAQMERRKQWWSFQQIIQPTPPVVQAHEWASDSIDLFILDQLEAAGLRPAKPASRETLIRRLYFNLIGLPPTAEQTAAFVTNDHPNAYEQAVDSLLDSEHFGERWARHWMDWVRYADSHGSEGDPEIVGAFHYRDYLIRALNDDVPYDQLLREHVAGDLLDDPRINQQLGINESLIGTAHWRFVFHGFAPTDALDERVRFTDDAVNVFSKAFLGLTISCARCHNHKFDAISQADYYSLFGIVSSARPGRSAIETPQTLLRQATRLDELKSEIRLALISRWELLSPDDIRDKLVAIQADKNGGPLAKLWATGRPDVQVDSSDKKPPVNDEARQTESIQELTKWFAYGTGLPSSDDQTFAPSRHPQRGRPGTFYLSENPQLAIDAINPSGIYSNLRSGKLPARLTSPEFEISPGDVLYVLVRGGGDASVRYAVQDYPRSGTVFPVRQLRGAEGARWQWQKFDLDYWKGDSAHIELAHASDGPLLAVDGKRSRFGIRQAYMGRRGQAEPPNPSDGWLDYLKSQELAGQDASDQDLAELISRAINDCLLAWKNDRLTDQQALFLDNCLQEGLLPRQLNKLPDVQRLVDSYRKIENTIPFPKRIPTLAEHTGRDHPLLERGDHKRPLENVPRRFIEAIDAEPYRTPLSGRRELAEDMLRADNPFTARVITNRIWHHLFGQGIVTTPDNFGRLGQEPSHPELLDYLSAELRDQHAWSIKALIRRIVLSSTWRQSSTAADHDSAMRLDPNNLLLSHANVRRLDAESLRDSVLLASGHLDRIQFGPSVPGSSSRRSVYVQARRNALDPFLTTFDSPVPFSTKGRRDETNVPAQSLFLMNSNFIAKQAQQLASRAMEQVDAEENPAAKIWEMTLARTATQSELISAKQFVDRQQVDYLDDIRKHDQLGSDLDRITNELSELQSKAMVRWQETQPIESLELKEQAAATVTRQALWRFDASEWNRAAAAKDVGTLRGSAQIGTGNLQLDGMGWLESPPIMNAITDKTLVALVRLPNLDQRGGGVLSIQTLDGNVFDAIVYGEKEPRRWIAGSDSFNRTQSFLGAGAETSAGGNGWVHLALVIKQTTNGQANVALYRNGQPYGKSYQTGVQHFDHSKWQVLLGMRHGKSASGNRMFSGNIQRAAVFGEALDSKQIARLASQSIGPTKTELASALSTADQRRYLQLEMDARKLESRRTIAAQMLPIVDASWQAWADLAQAMLNTKEFLYVK